MTRTGITVALITVFIHTIFASKLTDVDSHPIAETDGPASKLSFIEAISKVLKARDTKKHDLNQGNVKPLKRNSELFAYQHECTDDHIYCPRWAATGECFNNPIYMQTNCRYSCGICCANNNEQCGFWAATGECHINPDYMLVNCRLSCGECCADNHNRCEYWAATGECFEPLSMEYMLENCAMSCGQCAGGGLYNKRNVRRDIGNSPPGTRDDSHKQLRTGDKLKRAKTHWEPQASSLSKGPQGGSYYRRDVSREVGNSPPGTK